MNLDRFSQEQHGEDAESQIKANEELRYQIEENIESFEDSAQEALEDHNYSVLLECAENLCWLRDDLQECKEFEPKIF